MVSVACFALASILVLSGFRADLRPWEEGVIGAMLALFPTGVAAAWLYRKLQTFYPRREARAVSIAFGAFTPVSLLVALVLSPITGGYAEILVGRPFFGFLGAIMGTITGTWFLSFVVCALVLRVTRLSITVERSIDEKSAH
jgi:hypothetical protein